MRPVRLFMKRTIDLFGSLAALLLLSPLLLVLGAAIRAKLGVPVLFRQERLGRDGRPFEVIKFRTMTDGRAADGSLLPDEDRLTGLGRKLRELSVDELPELVNVIRGEMSLVGPRPLPAIYRDRYNPTQARRHEVRPGLTGWAQVNGRNEQTWPERFALDVWYVDNWTLVLDARILARTIGDVFRRRGVSARGHATMPEFMGDEEAN